MIPMRFSVFYICRRKNAIWGNCESGLARRNCASINIRDMSLQYQNRHFEDILHLIFFLTLPFSIKTKLKTVRPAQLFDWSENRKEAEVWMSTIELGFSNQLCWVQKLLRKVTNKMPNKCQGLYHSIASRSLRIESCIYRSQSRYNFL